MSGARFAATARSLLLERRFGPVAPGAKESDVLAALGPPSSKSNPGALPSGVEIWVYGRTLCRGHLEFHFTGGALWMIFADYLPLRDYRSAWFSFDPGCLGGLTLPAASDVIAALGVAPRAEPPWVPKGETPPPAPPPNMPRVRSRDWAKTARRAGVRDADQDEVITGELTWPSGAKLLRGHRIGHGPTGTLLASEDVVFAMTVPMNA